MPNPDTERGIAAAQEAQRIIALIAPNATHVDINTVNHNPGEKQMEILDYRADYPDGSIVRAPKIIIPLS